MPGNGNPFAPNSNAARAYDSGQGWAMDFAFNQEADRVAQVRADRASAQARARDAENASGTIRALRKSLIHAHPELSDAMVNQAAERIQSIDARADVDDALAAEQVAKKAVEVALDRQVWLEGRTPAEDPFSIEAMAGRDAQLAKAVAAETAEYGTPFIGQTVSEPADPVELPS